MLFRQLFDPSSYTYTYLLAARAGGEALVIDPVLENAGALLQLLHELDVKLAVALDTHLHADHVTALGALRERTGCLTVMGERSRAECVSARVRDGETLTVGGLRLRAIYTPGHTDDSFSFHLDEPDADFAPSVFTGDTLLIGGTGRTDFQNGDARAAYDSLFGRLLRLPDATRVYPAHDYQGRTVSSIGEERARNPRLQVGSADEYVRLMAALQLPNPKLMDLAIPANLRCGRAA